MSDPNKYVNVYIDTMMATLHEYLASSLQVKTQLKIANDLLQEKDGIISHLSNEIENVKNSSIKQGDMDNIQSQLNSYIERTRIAEDSQNALKNKVSHMDTLTTQLVEMKNEIKIRDDRIAAFAQDSNEKESQILSLKDAISEKEQDIAVLNSLLEEKNTEISKLSVKLENTKQTTNKAAADKGVKESSMVKVQLNTKSKPKELPINDDF